MKDKKALTRLTREYQEAKRDYEQVVQSGYSTIYVRDIFFFLLGAIFLIIIGMIIYGQGY